MNELAQRREYDALIQAELEELAQRREYDAVIEAELQELAQRREAEDVMREDMQARIQIIDELPPRRGLWERLVDALTP